EAFPRFQAASAGIRSIARELFSSSKPPEQALAGGMPAGESSVLARCSARSPRRPRRHAARVEDRICRQVLDTKFRPAHHLRQRGEKKWMSALGYAGLDLDNMQRPFGRARSRRTFCLN